MSFSARSHHPVAGIGGEQGSGHNVLLGQRIRRLVLRRRSLLGGERAEPEAERE